MKLDLIASTSKSSFNIPIVRIEYIHVLNRQSHTKYLKFMLYIIKFSSVNWGITPPPPPPHTHTHKNTTPLFFAKPPLKSANCSSPFFNQSPPIYWFLVTPLKIGFFSEPPYFSSLIHPIFLK